jgi:hypothetical protein
MLYLFYVEGLDDIWEHNEWVVLPQTKKWHLLVKDLLLQKK